MVLAGYGTHSLGTPIRKLNECSPPAEIGFDLHTRQIQRDFDAEVKACLDNIGSVLKAAAMDYSDVVSAQVFLTDITQFKRMNAVYASVFKTPRPARVTVGVAAFVVPTAHVEIMVTAQRQASKN